MLDKMSSQYTEAVERLLGYDDAEARWDDPDTSWDAADAADVAYTDGRILDTLIAVLPAGLTFEQISRTGQIRYNSISPRLTQMMRRGLVERHGKRETSSGRSAYIWYATDFALHNVVRPGNVEEMKETK